MSAFSMLMDKQQTSYLEFYRHWFYLTKREISPSPFKDIIWLWYWDLPSLFLCILRSVHTALFWAPNLLSQRTHQPRASTLDILAALLYLFSFILSHMRLLSHTPRFPAHHTLTTSPISLPRLAQPAFLMAMLVIMFLSSSGSLCCVW
jgi:hypothetical protein